MLLSALIVILGFLGVMPDTETTLTGSLQACSNEGGLVSIDGIKDMRCFTCMCNNGFVECQKERCPSEQGCHMLLETGPSCCKLCKGCMHHGVFHASGSEWRDPENPCRTMYCKAGVVTESDIQCYTPCRNPIPPAPGRCCATCPGCSINGQQVKEQREVTTPEDPCLKCRCEGGRMTCSKRACPVLNCHKGYMERLPGECCLQCRGSQRFIEPPRGCFLVPEVHQPGKSFHLDRCTQCSCLNGTSVCKRTACSVLECAPERQSTPPGHCCPHCPRTIEESRTTCTIGGRTYKDGETWRLDPCKSCVCHQGQPRCAMEMCNRHNTPCPPNSKLIHKLGECCPRCVESDGVCTVFGDPHYRTFDGKFYSFQGSCKYLLSGDCSGHSYSIRVTNDARRSKTSSWTKTISVKIGELKINLGQKMRVKVNGKRVEPPYKLDDKLAINKTMDSLLVFTHVGVKVLWDGHSFLEVSAPSSYKGKLCGLCGNFNSVPRDDFANRRGKLLSDADKFGMAWRVGGKKACTRPQEDLTREPQCMNQNQNRRLRQCKPLKAEPFESCHGKLNPMMYFKSCFVDMCECPSGRCYCEAFMAYAHECQRLGVLLPDWRSATGCVSGWADSRRLH